MVKDIKDWKMSGRTRKVVRNILETVFFISGIVPISGKLNEKASKVN